MKELKEYRNKVIFSMIPEGVETILDIGHKENMFKEDYKVTTLDVMGEADILQDLNKNQKLDLEDNSFDIVVVNQILEHLTDVEEIISECKRVSKKYILVGLPNEFTYGARIKFLFGKLDGTGYLPYWHKHRFNIKEIYNFINRFFGEYEKKEYLGAFSFAGYLPDNIRHFAAKNYPELFSKEMYFLVKVK